MRRQRGYVLVLALASMALIAFVAANFSQRIDALRASAGSMRDEARARLAAADALAVAQYWLASHAAQPMGYGDANGMVLADGRFYRLPGGAVVAFQDLRGLLSVNIVDRPMLTRLLQQQGVTPEATDRYLDVLEDYTDLDHLKRLNGAERSGYADQGLPGPRNDFLRSLSELALMPTWRDDVALVGRLRPLLSTSRGGWINPNTAPVAVLRAVFPQAAPVQIERFVADRALGQFDSPAQITRSYGLPVGNEDILMFAGREVQLTVWAPGLPQAIQYNLVLLPAGGTGPWLVTEQHLRARPQLRDDATDTQPFPLAVAVTKREPAMGKDRP
ncbi:MAG: type II secretion system protein GspK [Rubrivivax sp.]|nr:type II secretion system protein GspK [Rubrivivax sp.]